MNIRKDASEVVSIVVNGASDIVGELADAGRKAYCKQYSENPYWVMAKDNIIVPIVTRTLDKFCSDFPPPPPPPPSPFTGGQCENELYRIRAVYQFTVSGSSNVNDRDEVIGSVQGIIESFTDNGNSSAQSIIVDVITTASATPVRAFKNLGFGSSLVPGSLSISFPAVNPEGELCGDPPPPGYDPIPPPSDVDLTSSVNITNNEGDTYNYNVSIDRDPGGTIVFPPSISVNSVSVSIDVGGITVGGTTNNFSGGGGGDNGDTFAPEASEPPPELLEEEKEEEEEPPPATVEKLVAIVVSLTKIPSNANVTDGRGAPDVYYAGWIEFKNKSTYYGRQFINFSKQRFQAPEENDGYAITYKTGFSGVITEITEEAI